MKYKGFYVNLDRSPGRRRHIEDELSRNGLTGYSRFTATDGNALHFPNPGLKNGEIGCFTSFYRLLDANRDSDQPLHVIEDDILLSPQTEQVLDWAINSGHLDKYDIIYTDVAVPLLNDACQAYKAFYDAAVRRDPSGKIENVAFSVVDMRTLIFASMCSFLVNPNCIGKLADLLGTALRVGAPQPVDLYVRTLCQERRINVGCVFPFVTSMRPDGSFATTRGDDPNALSAFAAGMLRHSFFIGCDWQACLDLAKEMLAQPVHGDTHRQLMLHLLGYSLMPGYKKC